MNRTFSKPKVINKMKDNDTTTLTQDQIKRPAFENPYSREFWAREKEYLTTIVAPVSKLHAQTIRCIRPMQGTTSAVISILWKKLINELHERNITNAADSGEFEDFVRGCHIISHEEWAKYTEHFGTSATTPPVGGGGLPDSSASGVVRNSTTPNDSGGTAEPRHDVTPTDSKPSDVQSGGGSKGKRSRKGPQSQGTSEETNQ